MTHDIYNNELVNFYKSVTFLLVASNSTIQPSGTVNIGWVWLQSKSAINGISLPEEIVKTLFIFFY